MVNKWLILSAALLLLTSCAPIKTLCTRSDHPAGKRSAIIHGTIST
ncbi:MULTISPECIES: hypothetical protein [unclassified Paenibacillus]|nr:MULTISPECIES: hypothetical protein [unclassified Paenibacillus]MBP1155229.1 putative lipoprotein YajG [Paenibacillus sp. PvP091]MBP1169387.1 putative lipoprotein YajG [Paenibacillus sp. PvR098]MBP2440415.1 putative lipoprotein YajG [Paenibacillus sp. PvP052]